MLLEQFLEVVYSELEKVEWIYISTGYEGVCSFSDGCGVAGNILFEFVLSIKDGSILMTLTNVETQSILGILKYDAKTTRWFGRSFISGFIQISTAVDKENIWNQLAYPLRYMSGQHVQKSLGVLYVDDIVPDYVIPTYDIKAHELFNAVDKSQPALVLVACDKLQQFTNCVQALAQNPESTVLPVYLFLDKPQDASLFRDSNAHIEVFLQSFPHGVVIQRTCSWGYGKHIIDIYRQLFDVCGHPYIYIIEDTVVVKSNYFSVLQNLWDWVNRNEYHNVGIIQGCGDTTHGEEYVDIATGVLSGYSMSKACWEQIKDVIYTYETDYLFARYNERPHRTIRKYFNSLFNISMAEGYPLSREQLQVLKATVSVVESSEQGAIIVALQHKGLSRIQPSAILCYSVERYNGVIENTVIDEWDQVEFEEWV